MIEPERFLNPELLESHLAASLDFLLVLARLVGFEFDGGFGSAVFELNLGAESPPFAEVVAEHDDGMREVDLPVAFVVAVLLGVGVAVDVVGVEIVAEGSFAVAAYGEARDFYRYGVLGGENGSEEESCQETNS